LNTANGITLIYDLLKDDSVNGHTKIEIINDFDKVFSLDLTDGRVPNMRISEALSYTGSNEWTMCSYSMEFSF